LFFSSFSSEITRTSFGILTFNSSKTAEHVRKTRVFSTTRAVDPEIVGQKYLGMEKLLILEKCPPVYHGNATCVRNGNVPAGTSFACIDSAYQEPDICQAYSNKFDPLVVMFPAVRFERHKVS
jgi:hypothetical protein